MISVGEHIQHTNKAICENISQPEIYIPLDELVDFEAELERLQKEKKKLEGKVKRSKGILSNENFGFLKNTKKMVDEIIPPLLELLKELTFLEEEIFKKNHELNVEKSILKILLLG